MTVAIAPPPVKIRPARPEDFAFILDTWRRSYERAPAVTGADPAHYRLEMANVITRVVSRAEVRVACATDDERTLAGYAVIEHPGELVYLYVRGGEPQASMRNLGIARMLLEGVAIRSYTFRTPAFERRMKPKERGWKFTPRYTL